MVAPLLQNISKKVKTDKPIVNCCRQVISIFLARWSQKATVVRIFIPAKRDRNQQVESYLEPTVELVDIRVLPP